MTSLDLDLADIDIASQELQEVGVPHERFRLLREHDPVHWHPWPWSGAGILRRLRSNFVNGIESMPVRAVHA